MTKSVRAWEETLTLPTYPPFPADLNPMFLERRVNQGTSGRVYPNPFTDGLSSESEERTYRAIHLENEYLKLTMLPEIGGRIHAGMDKTNGYDFFYRQHVIKPALIGLFGAWISGGVEFNWPQHHRPSTFMPTHHVIEEHADGSVTVWMSEHEPMDRMKGMVGICLYPGKAFLEMKVQLYNRTPSVQTFLWWVNVGVHVHDQYQVVFPPDVTIVTDHSKRSMVHFPIARSPYYGIDYSEGVDISWYKHIPVPTSYFVWETEYDYFGGYDHRQDAGLVHVANRHIAPGKKMFTWGAGEFARGWEDNLTDADGPYIELMAGVYTDNQPDFSWLQPYETKTFSQFWYPVQRIGPPKNANRRAAVNLECDGDRIRVGVAVTEALAGARVLLGAGQQVLLDEVRDLAPGAPLVAELALPADIAEPELLLRLLDGQGGEVIRYAPQVIQDVPLPEPFTPPPPPDTFETVEELYLTGLHLEQYHHPTLDPEPYWEEALRRDPTDARSNNALGLVQLRRGNFPAALAHFQHAVDKLTRRNPNPRDGEPFYNLGMALRYLGDEEGAYAAFYKAIWSYAWQAAGYYALAEIDCARGDFVTALEHIDRALVTNTMNIKARNLRAVILRRLGRLSEAATCVCETVGLDPLDMWARNEALWQSRVVGKSAAAESQLAELVEMMRLPDPLAEAQSYLDMAFDYANAGLWQEADDVLRRCASEQGDGVYPIVLYALGYVAYRQGDTEVGSEFYHRASRLPADYCFPVRLEELLILEHARQALPEDPRIAYYLGNLYYDKKRYDEAIEAWEFAARGESAFSIPWRNLGIAYFNVRRDPQTALMCYERALQISAYDGRVLSEFDQLLQRAGFPPEERLARLEQHLPLVRQRDDLSVELATLYNLTEQPEKALDYMLSRRFHPWEGGTGRISAQYVEAHIKLGQRALSEGHADQALEHFQAALETYPDVLGERKHLLWPDAHVHYHLGLAQQALGDDAGARASFERVLAMQGDLSMVSYYQALALRALGDEAGARQRFEQMLELGHARLSENAQQAFATSVPQFVFAEADLETRRRIELTYLIGMAHVGLGQIEQAKVAFETVLTLDPGHGQAWVQMRKL